MKNSRKKNTHSTTKTQVNMNADARAWTCFFSCMRATDSNVVEPYSTKKETECQSSTDVKKPS